MPDVRGPAAGRRRRRLHRRPGRGLPVLLRRSRRGGHRPDHLAPLPCLRRQHGGRRPGRRHRHRAGRAARPGGTAGSGADLLHVRQRGAAALVLPDQPRVTAGPGAGNRAAAVRRAARRPAADRRRSALPGAARGVHRAAADRAGARAVVRGRRGGIRHAGAGHHDDVRGRATGLRPGLRPEPDQHRRAAGAAADRPGLHVLGLGDRAGHPGLLRPAGGRGPVRARHPGGARHGWRGAGIAVL